MLESEFHLRVDALLIALQNILDNVDTDIDSELTGGILNITFEDDSKVIVNRQTPNRELWVAAKSGGFHFKFDPPSWRDTRTGERLEILLTRVISAQAHASIEIAFDA
jgi:CyaY protein